MRRLTIIAVLAMMAVVDWGRGAEAQAPKVAPLFPVELEQEFRGAQLAFEEVMDLILEHYYSEEITEEALYLAAVKGMLRHVSPPDNPELGRIWTPEEYEDIENSLNGVQVSIGIKSSFNANEGSLTVTDVTPGSPAEMLLQPYDRILRIDGDVLKGKEVSELSGLLEGDVGTDVTLTVVRDVKVFDITITRAEFKTPNLTVERLPSGIVLVDMRKFTKDISKELKDELTALHEEQALAGTIIDLRNNTGGVFIESLRVAELFLPVKHVLLRTLKRSEKTQNYVSSNTAPFETGIALLVNRNTASSSEVLVGALQDHRKALVVGEKTYGKGVFEKTFTLQNDYRVKFIIGAMYTPRRKAWQSKGLLPDFAVKQDVKTYKAVAKLSINDRLRKDVPLITAHKLLR